MLLVRITWNDNSTEHRWVASQIAIGSALGMFEALGCETEILAYYPKR